MLTFPGVCSASCVLLGAENCPAARARSQRAGIISVANMAPTFGLRDLKKTPRENGHDEPDPFMSSKDPKATDEGPLFQHPEMPKGLGTLSDTSQGASPACPSAGARDPFLGDWGGTFVPQAPPPIEASSSLAEM